jgi:hypothetical protein
MLTSDSRRLERAEMLTPNFCAKNAELHLSQRKSKAAYLSGIVHSQRVRINHEHLRLRPRVPNQAHSPESEPISTSLEPSLITSDHAAVACGQYRSCKLSYLSTCFRNTCLVRFPTFLQRKFYPHNGVSYLINVLPYCVVGGHSNVPLPARC